MLQIVERPRPCSYLPDQRASLEITFDPSVTPRSYAELLRRGYRRFGWQLFRPMCRTCRSCISMRVVVPEFQLNAGDRRVMRKNAGIRRVLAPAIVTEQHVDLFNRYQLFMHRQRGWALQTHSTSSYFEAFVSGPDDIGLEWRYFDGEKLVGVSLMDVAPDCVSLVYFYYDPEWRPNSPGRFSILNQLLFAQLHQIRHAYLGYWVEACQSLNYKSRFGPYEILERYVSPQEEPTWLRPAFQNSHE